MDATPDLTKRLHALEEEVGRLQILFAQSRGMVSGRTAPDFLERSVGIFADDPTFDEAVRLGREWRNADRGKWGADE